MSEDDLRVGDAERDKTASQLSEHFAAGRLDHDEFAERSDRALRARTRRDLDVLLSDLPALPITPQPSSSAPAPAVVSPEQLSERAEWRRSTLSTWAVFAVFFVVLWAATGGGYFWPVFPILGWGIGVAVSGIQAYSRPTDVPHGQGSNTMLPPAGNDSGEASSGNRNHS